MKLLIGGSPCTHWSIAQTKNRETEASGIGWELFLNYRIARDKYKPDYFLYENNKSMSPAIRTQITAELGVEPVLINSALVSAQNRQRLYWVGRRNPDGTYIKLADGFYIIRKLTVTECKRLQTVPEEYVFPVSNSQAYKMLGNGWTVDVIAHIMSHFEGLTTEPVEVLSMYDGMSCGHIALDKLGVQPWLLRYYATEIDKYAIQTTQHNFPETIQLGDAFQVRNDDWRVGE